MNLTFIPDDYINEKFETHPRWVVTLSDGRNVYQDDDRPEFEEKSAWIRLGNFLKIHDELSIIDMTIGFRSHIVRIGERADGYFFSKGIFGGIGTDQIVQFFIVGTLYSNILLVNKYILPEMEIIETEIRNPFEEGEKLICQKNVLINLDKNLLPQKSTVQTLSILPN